MTFVSVPVIDPALLYWEPLSYDWADLNAIIQSLIDARSAMDAQRSANDILGSGEDPLSF